MHEYLVPEVSSGEVLAERNVSDFVIVCRQVLHVDGHFFRAVIDVNVDDVEDLVVVAGPDLHCAVLLEASPLVHQNRFELHTPHPSIINCCHLTS